MADDAVIEQTADTEPVGGTVFGDRVPRPEYYGVVGMDNDGTVTQIVEKRSQPPSDSAVSGLYFLDATAP